jgi:hypothetical protein
MTPEEIRGKCEEALDRIDVVSRQGASDEAINLLGLAAGMAKYTAEICERLDSVARELENLANDQRRRYRGES